MTKMILIFAAFAVVLLLFKTFMRDDLTPLQRGVAQDLQRYGITDVDVTTLTPDQVTRLSLALSGDDNNDEKRAAAEVILRGARSEGDP